VRLDAIVDIELSYKWLRNGVSIATGSTSNFYYARKTGNYSLKVTRNSDGCVDTSNSLLISVIDTPAISTTSNLVFCIGDSISLNMPSIINGTYSWYQNNLPILNQTTSQLFVYSANSYYGIINYPQGCALTTDTVTTITNCTVGTIENKNDLLNFSILPNPSSGYTLLTIENEKPQHIKIQISNSVGSIIKTIIDEKTQKGIFKYDLGTNLISGIYYCNIITENKSYIKKFIINR